MATWGFGMPPGFDALIARKYAIQQQEADARSNALDASANVDNIKAGLMPAESAANVAKTEADTDLTKTTTRFTPLLSMSTAFDTLARGKQSLATADYTGAQTKGLQQLQQTFSPFSLGLF